MSRPYVKGERFPDGAPRNVLKIGALLIRRDVSRSGWNYYWGNRWLGIISSSQIIINTGGDGINGRLWIAKRIDDKWHFMKRHREINSLFRDEEGNGA